MEVFSASFVKIMAEYWLLQPAKVSTGTYTVHYGIVYTFFIENLDIDNIW